MWGKREDLDQAIKQWNALVENVLAKERVKRDKKKAKSGWVKPDKHLNDKQKRKKERRDAREREDKDYLGIAPTNQTFKFNGFFLIPISDVHIGRIIGEKTEVLDPIRIDTKCYIWHDPNSNVSIVSICINMTIQSLKF